MSAHIYIKDKISSKRAGILDNWLIRPSSLREKHLTDFGVKEFTASIKEPSVYLTVLWETKIKLNLVYFQS